MKKVLLTSAVALAAFGAVQAVSADDSYASLIKDALGVKVSEEVKVDEMASSYQKTCHFYLTFMRVYKIIP